MSDRLKSAMSGVPADSPPADSDPNPDSHDQPESGSAAGDPGSTGEGEDGKSGRTVDNVRGELIRKMEREREYFRGHISSLEAKIDQLSGLLQNSPQSAPPQGGNQLDAMTVDQLKAMRDQVPEEQRPAFDQYLADRKLEEAAERKFKALYDRRSYETREQEANREAASRWPELRDPTSDFYAITSQILDEYGSNAETNPRAVLDAANEAGLRLGLTPKGAPSVGGRQGRSGLAPGGSHGKPSPAKGDDADLPSMESVEDVARRLQDAMPGRKFSKEQLERIRKNTAAYTRHADDLGYVK